MTRGRRTHGNASAARMSGASYRSMRSAASFMRPPRAQNTTSTARIAAAQICLATACSLWTRAPESVSGTYQMVHHDIWDYDDATAPKLLTVQHEGKPVDIVAHVTKQGFVWVFDRVTGKPLWPIEERPVPASDMPGEEDLADTAVSAQAAAVCAAEVHRR